MIKVYGYVRVSGKSQTDKGGYDRQEQTIKKYCAANNCEIEKIFKETISGTKDKENRPVFLEMLQAILNNGIKIIVVEGLDRLAREVRIQDSLLIYLVAKKITLISARTEENITEAISSDPMKKALVQIQAVFSELEKNQIILRMKKGREKKKKETGRCSGPLRYGSTPEEKEILKRISYMRRLSKGQTKRRSYQDIADILNGEGIATRQGKKWSGALVFHIHERGGK
ncbi:MAG: resolvase [Syntrophus sp. (in: bacteria)]|nr:resolvase [Syntrophus sp. (in: bacteria)]